MIRINPKAIIFRLPAVLIIAFIWMLSSQSRLPVPEGVFGIDKVLHFIAYVALAAAVGLWFSKKIWAKKPMLSFLICVAAASAYGAVDEIHQYFVPGRSCDIFDWIADTLGAATGAVVIMLCVRKIKAL